MNDINFFSSNTYLPLPTASNPKVMLAVDSSLLCNNAFKLYNPFSKKAIYLKSVLSFLFIRFNPIFKTVMPFKKKVKGDFIKHLENELNTPLVSSVYYATAKDKVVLQLQANNQILGYLKFPLNKLGIKHINNEIKAIELLSKKKIISPAIMVASYKDAPYIFLKELKGTIKQLPKAHLQSVLKQFYKKNSFVLNKHPRIKQLLEDLQNNGFQKKAAQLKKRIAHSTKTYKEVYEHGDFTPWNLITVNNTVVPFDFEYFEEEGLEYLDLIKYYYQIGTLLAQKTKEDLIEFIKEKIPISEITVLLHVFLLKEILRKKEEKEYDTNEQELLLIIENETT